MPRAVEEVKCIAACQLHSILDPAKAAAHGVELVGCVVGIEEVIQAFIVLIQAATQDQLKSLGVVFDKWFDGREVLLIGANDVKGGIRRERYLRRDANSMVSNASLLQ
jgi:hypothetical protein